jgi:mono/diheme cytochrome c family protein
MKIHSVSLIFAAAGLLSLSVSTTAQTPAPKVADDVADGAFVARATFSEKSGEAMYRRVCAACHMPDAKGAEGAGIYPSLAGNKKLQVSGYPVYVILHGLNGMPAIGDMMTDQQVADVTNYIRSNFGNKYRDSVSAADVKMVR